jgi:hypothetical protein
VPGDEVRARRFVLVGDEDNERAALNAGRGESVEMAFAGRNGKVRTALGMTQSGARFWHLPTQTRSSASGWTWVRLGSKRFLASAMKLAGYEPS